MPMEIVTVPCLDDNYAYLVHDPASGATAAFDVPEAAPIISSDLIRAADTATAIESGRLRLPHDPDLREINFGDWELRRFDEVSREDPGHIRAYWETPGDVAPPNGESWNATCARVDGAIDRLLGAHGGQDLIVVAHFGAILTQVARAEGLSGSDAFGHKIDNLSVTVIETVGDWSATLINHNP